MVAVEGGGAGAGGWVGEAEGGVGGEAGAGWQGGVGAGVEDLPLVGFFGAGGGVGGAGD